MELFWRFGQRSVPRNTAQLFSDDPRTDEAVSTLLLIRKLLRRFPFWMQGHQRLAEISLLLDDVGTAYAAAQCLLEGSGEDMRLRGEAYLLLGRSFLRRGDWRSSLASLEQAEKLLPQDATVSEEQAAAHMAAGNNTHALRILQGIPASDRTPAGQAALDFLRTSTHSPPLGAESPLHVQK